MAGIRGIPWLKIAVALVALALLVIFVSLFWDRNSVVLIVLMLASVVVLLRSQNRRRDVIPFLVGAILGPSMEMVVIHFGGWQYANPSIGGIPVWLPFLWGLTVVFLLKISRWLMPT